MLKLSSFFLVVALCLTTVISLVSAQLPPATPGFMCGVSSAPGDLKTLTVLQKQLHTTTIRRYFMWKYAQPYVSKKTFEYNLTVEMVKANPQKYVVEWSKTVPKWSYFDSEISTMCGQMKSSTGKAIHPIIEVFEGTNTGLPRFLENKTEFVGPCTVGTEAYLAHSYRWVRAVTMRYAKTIQEVCNVKTPLFQIENEFNEAGLSVAYGQRAFCLQWFNWTFLTQSLSTLRQAVKDEAGDSVLVTQNLHTDIPKSVHTLLKLPGFYVDAAESWNDLVDVWSLDAYPNMIIASPMRAYKIQDRISNVTAITNNTKRVFIMETGFPRLDESVAPLPPSTPSNWSVLDFSPANQARYSELAIENVLAARGSGILFFKATKSKGMQPPNGGYLPEDLDLFIEIQKVLETHNITQFIHWVLQPFTNHLTEVLTRGGVYLHRADSEDGWALFEENGDPTPAFNSISKLYAKICG